MGDSEVKTKSKKDRRSRSHSSSSSGPRSRSPQPRTRSRSRSRSRGRDRERGKDQRQGNGPADEKLAQYIKSLMDERNDLDQKKYPFIHRLIASEIENITKGAGGVVPDDPFIDLYNDTPISLTVKAIPPTKVFPKFNYAGRIIGPRGTYLKALMKETMCKMVLLGKGVMKDKEKESDLKETGDPRYFHLYEDMHVSVQVTAPPSEAYAKVAYALACLKKQVMSDNRGLETLPWITHATRVLEGTATFHGSRMPSPPRRPTRPPPQDHYTPYHSHPRESPYQHKSYFEREAVSVYRPRPPREESPPPSKAMEYAANAAFASRSYSGQGLRRSPGPVPGGHDRYDYDPYSGHPGPSDHSSGKGYWNPSPRGPPSPRGWEKSSKLWSSESPRYAPYKK